jgi:hypothetical protein
MMIARMMRTISVPIPMYMPASALVGKTDLPPE